MDAGHTAGSFHAHLSETEGGMSEEIAGRIQQALRVAREAASVSFWEAEPHWLREAGFTYLIIRLRDALGGLHELDRRIAFRDEVAEGDVTDLVVKMRGAACHLGSSSRTFSWDITLGFSCCIGKGRLGRFGDVVLENPHENEVALFYGGHRIFLHRHIQRAIVEGEAALAGLVGEKGWRPLPS
jgi:hypothetical protein